MGSTDLLITGIISIIGWIVIGFRVMGLCNVSGVSNGWLGFVPFLNYTRWARLAGANPWLVLVWIIPIVGWIIGAILSFVWLFRISEGTASKSPWFWVYLILTLASGSIGAIFHGLILAIIVIILTIVAIYSLWMIFNPEKPVSANA
jgi:hypothetical protein